MLLFSSSFLHFGATGNYRKSATHVKNFVWPDSEALPTLAQLEDMPFAPVVEPEDDAQHGEGKEMENDFEGEMVDRQKPDTAASDDETEDKEALDREMDDTEQMPDEEVDEQMWGNPSDDDADEDDDADRQQLCAFFHHRAERRWPPTDEVDYSRPMETGRQAASPTGSHSGRQTGSQASRQSVVDRERAVRASLFLKKVTTVFEKS